MASSTKDRENNIRDDSGLVDKLVDALTRKGVARLVHFGLFRVVSVEGRKRYDFKKRRMVPVGSFKKITFTPAQGFRDMLNTKGRVYKSKKK